MNRRETLKAIGVGSLSAGLLLDACKPNTTEDKKAVPAASRDTAHRLPAEMERERRLNESNFFTSHEMATITALSDIIIPKDQRSGSASEAGVPAFIEFMAKDRPEHQVPLRGGLRWLDMQCLNRYENTFVRCSEEQQLELLEEIAYPAHAKPGMEQGVAFFDRLRGLVATGFFTSKMGIADLGYVGNRPNVWKGVPEEIIKDYGLEDITFDMFRL